MDGSARLTGPVAGPPGIIMTGFDLGQVGFTLEEFFLESTATRFEPVGPTGADGHWEVIPAGQAPFTTRLVVCRPADPGAYTGTVILEWLNVSAGFDAPVHWMLTHRQVMRAGWAWVGVSAQRAGVEGGSIFDTAGEEPDPGSRRVMVLPALKESDPVRYGGCTTRAMRSASTSSPRPRTRSAAAACSGRCRSSACSRPASPSQRSTWSAT
jgi:alpha/beta hydrolase family protein